MGRASSEIFVGRDDELAVVEACAHDAERGRPWVVVVEGPAGVGKSAFARRALAELAGFVVLEAAADESAAEEPLWLAGQLAAPTAATSPFAVGMELLGVLADRQSAGPTALLVEDIHWAHEPSRRALVTALRRLDGDRVLAILTTRPDGHLDEAWSRLVDDRERCCRVTLGRLSAAEVAAVAERAGVPLGPNAATRLQRHTAGHRRPLKIACAWTSVPNDR